jgi:hypothetical protein
MNRNGRRKASATRRLGFPELTTEQVKALDNALFARRARRHGEGLGPESEPDEMLNLYLELGILESRPGDMLKFPDSAEEWERRMAEVVRVYGESDLERELRAAKVVIAFCGDTSMVIKGHAEHDRVMAESRARGEDGIVPPDDWVQIKCASPEAMLLTERMLADGHDPHVENEAIRLLARRSDGRASPE